MYEVAIAYTNGSNVVFYAQEINLDFDPSKLIGSSARYSIIQKFTYKDVDGEAAFLYLKPGEIAGIVTARVDSARYGLTVRQSS